MGMPIRTILHDLYVDYYEESLFLLFQFVGTFFPILSAAFRESPCSFHSILFRCCVRPFIWVRAHVWRITYMHMICLEFLSFVCELVCLLGRAFHVRM